MKKRRHETVLIERFENMIIVIETDRGEEALKINSGTKGMENAKEGSRVRIKYSAKTGDPVSVEIFPAGRRDRANISDKRDVSYGIK